MFPLRRSQWAKTSYESGWVVCQYRIALVFGDWPTYAILSETRALAQLSHKTFEFFLQSRLPSSLIHCHGWQRKYPLLHHGPDVGDRLSWGNSVDGGQPGSIIVPILKRVRATMGVGRSFDSPVGVSVDRFRYAGHSHVPLGQIPGNGTVDGRAAQVVWVGDGPAYKPVQHAVLESREKLWGETYLHQQLVVLRLTVAVNQDVRAMAVGTQKHRVPIELFVGQALAVVGCFNEGIRDAVGKADELDPIPWPSPFRIQGCDDLESSRRVARIV